MPVTTITLQPGQKRLVHATARDSGENVSPAFGLSEPSTDAPSIASLGFVTDNGTLFEVIGHTAGTATITETGTRGFAMGQFSSTLSVTVEPAPPDHWTFEADAAVPV